MEGSKAPPQEHLRGVDTRHLLGVWGSLAVVSLVQKIGEMLVTYRYPGMLEAMDLVRGNLTFYGGLLLLFAGLCAGIERITGQRLARAVLYVAGAIVLGIELAAHNFYCATGS